MNLAAASVIGLALLFGASGDTLIVPTQYASIQDALDAAADGDTVIVLPGVYTENVVFKGKAVHLCSDLDGDPDTRDPAPKLTVIDGNRQGSVVRFFKGEGEGAVLEGFTLRNGTGTPHAGGTLGGGIACSNASSPIIRGNIITGNLANGGGGINCLDGSCPKILDNALLDNEVVGSGGGIRCFTNSDALISGNFVSGNRAGSKGGGFFIAFSVPVVAHNVLENNEAKGGGGGIFFGRSHDTVLVDGNIIRGNRVKTGVAGGIAIDATILEAVNNLIIDNEGVNAAGIYIAWSKPILSNNTVIGNKAKSWGGGLGIVMAQPIITNSIFWDNEAPTGPEIHATGGGAQITYCNVKGGHAGQGNIDAPPGFVDQDAGDFHLLFTSPCRDAGSKDAPGLPAFDFEGDPRVWKAAPDMGADEFHAYLYFSGEASPGGFLTVKILGEPALAPILLWVGSGTLDPPLPTAYGNWYLQPPLIFEVVLDPVPPDGVVLLPYHFPPDFPAPWLLAMQGLVGSSLTNLSLLTIE